MYVVNPNKTIGPILIIVGLALYVLGIVLLFDRLLLLLGNSLFLAGTGYLSGGLSFMMFLLSPTRLKGSLSFFSGFFMILVNWSFLGTMLQLFGFFFLFRGFIPEVYSASKYIPGVGPYICSSASIRSIIEKISGTSKTNVI